MNQEHSARAATETASSFVWTEHAGQVAHLIDHLDEGVSRIDRAIIENKGSHKRTAALLVYKAAARCAVVALRELHDALCLIEDSI